MDIKKLITGGIAGGVVFFFLGWLVYGIVLENFLRHNPGEVGLIGRTEPEFMYLIAGQMLYGFLLTYILLKGDAGTILSGLVTGAVVGFLLSAAVDFTMYGTSIILSKKGILADVAGFTFMSAIAGAVIAAAAGRKLKQ